MKTIEHLNRQSPKNLNKSLKRKKVCKFTKGEHKYILVVPKFLKSFGKYAKMTPDEFDKYWNEEKESYFMKDYDSHHYECEYCGKQKSEYIKKLSTLQK